MALDLALSEGGSPRGRRRLRTEPGFLVGMTRAVGISLVERRIDSGMPPRPPGAGAIGTRASFRDVTEHGDPGCNGMVTLFAGRLVGFATIASGWVHREGLGCRLALVMHDQRNQLEAGRVLIVWTDRQAGGGLPLDDAIRLGRLRRALAAFRLASTAVGDETPTHTHTWYL